MINTYGKNSTDFVNFGTYEATQADILKEELEKRGVPVKKFYPGTEIGTEATAGARFTAYTLLIREIDIPLAKEVCNKLNIKPVDKMPLPKTWEWTIQNKFFTKYFLSIGLPLFLLGMIMAYLRINSKISSLFGLIGSVLIFISGILLFIYWFINEVLKKR